MAKPQNLYCYKDSILPLERTKILSAFEALELKHRGGKLSYLNAEDVVQGMAKHMKENWGKEDLGFFGEFSKKVSEGKPLTADVFMQALREFLEAKLKAKLDHMATDFPMLPDYAQASRSFRMKLAANMTLAAVLGISPDPKLPKEKINFKGSTIRWQVSQKPVRLVIETHAVNSIDLHVFFLYDGTLERCWLLGYADKNTMATCEVEANKGRNCHCLPFEKILPVASMMELLRVKSVPSGVLIEQVPNQSEIPITTTLTVPEQPTRDTWDEFYKSIDSKLPHDAH